MKENLNIPADRWVEIDLQWFDPEHFENQIIELISRLGPLYDSVSGLKGLILNIGWLVDLVTLWQGREDQVLPLGQRALKWNGYTYGFLRKFLQALRLEAEKHLSQFKIGALFVNWGYVIWPPDVMIYTLESEWYKRHPEIYDPPRSFIGMPELRPGAILRGDHNDYASAPYGIKDGTYFRDFFSEQWGNLSRFLNLDALVLRDGFMGPMVYVRKGPFGVTASSDPRDLASWTESVKLLFRAVKRANPNVFLMGYSSGISAIADWRVGCVDFEAVISDGAIDAWIDQTWSGAWQDWWSQEWKGWTFQLAYLLLHKVMIQAANKKRSSKCKHYFLVETWDAWEPWDTLHQVPGKLKWGIWAYSHACVMEDGVPYTSDGAYISWANRRDGSLLSEKDIQFIKINLDNAQRSAAGIKEVYGPCVVYNRNAMEWLSTHRPDDNVSEWLDEQVGFLLKWGLPILSATRIEWIGSLTARSFIFSLLHRIDENTRETIIRETELIPSLFTGRADMLEPQIRKAIGIDLGEIKPKGYYYGRIQNLKEMRSDELPKFNILHLPPHQQITGLGPETEILFDTETSPLIVRKGARIYWQPQDWCEPSNQFLPRYQIGSLVPYFLVAHSISQMLIEYQKCGITTGFTTPLTFHYWKSGDRCYFLIGNLETGITGDSRLPRSSLLFVSKNELMLEPGKYVLREMNGDIVEPSQETQQFIVFRVNLPSEGCLILNLEKL